MSRSHLAFVGVAVLVCLALALSPAEAKKPASFADLPLAQLFGIKGKESGGHCVGCTLSTPSIPRLFRSFLRSYLNNLMQRNI